MSGDILNNEGESRRRYSRRSLLRAGVGVSSVALLPGVVGGGEGKPTNEERAAATRERAIRIREQTGSRERMEKFFKENSDHFRSVPHDFSLVAKDNDTKMSDDGGEVSANEWFESTFNNSLTLTYYTNCASDPYATIFYDIFMNTDDGIGAGGPDQISLSWNHDHFRYNEGTAAHDSDMSNLSLYDEEFNGVDWEWKDGKSCGFSCSDKDFWVTCDAELLATDQERAVQAEYHDMYDAATVSSFSVDASGGVSFTFSTTGQWDEHARKVKEGNEATYGCVF